MDSLLFLAISIICSTMSACYTSLCWLVNALTTSYIHGTKLDIILYIVLYTSLQHIALHILMDPINVSCHCEVSKL